MINKTNSNRFKQTIRVFVFAVSFFSVSFMGTFPLKSQAFSPSSVSSSSIQATDTIVTKFRVHNGKQQYRRWNQTRACWVDPDWIDLN